LVPWPKPGLVRATSIVLRRHEDLVGVDAAATHHDFVNLLRGPCRIE
jgi:hypothetical protein